MNRLNFCDSVAKKKKALDLEISLGLIFMEIFWHKGTGILVSVIKTQKQQGVEKDEFLEK